MKLKWLVSVLAASTAALGLTTVPATAAPAATTPFTASINPGTAQADVPAAYTLTFTAKQAINAGWVTFAVPAGWTAPQATVPSDVGFIVTNKGTCSQAPNGNLSAASGTGPWSVHQSGLYCAAGQYFTITYANAYAATVGSGTYTFGPATASPSTGAGSSITAPSVTVSPGPTTQFALSGATTTPAGAKYKLTVTAEDAGGDVTPAYAGTVVLSSTDTHPSTSMPTGTLKNGTGTFNPVLTWAGPQTIYANDSVTPTIHGHLALTVTAGAPSHLAFTNNPPGPATVNTAIQNLAVSVFDAYGNTVTTANSGTVTLAINTGPAGQTTFTSGTTSEPVVAGVAHFTNLVVAIPGGYTLKATPSGISGIKTSVTSLTFSVAAHVVISPAIVSGGTVGSSYTTTFQAGGGVGAYHWSASGLPADGLSLSAAGVLSGTPTTATTVGPFTVNVSDSASPANTASATYSLMVDKGTAPFTATIDNSSSGTTISYGTSAVLVENGLPAGATGTVTFSTATNPTLCSFSYPTSNSCITASTLTAGTYSPITATFTDSDGNYNDSTATNNLSLTVSRVTPTVTWATPAAITYGTPLSGTQLDASAPIAGSYSYDPAAGAVLTAGSHPLSVTFTPTDQVDYNAATGGVTLTVNQATPVVSWSTPSSITYGTALDSTQLDATADADGTFVYAPAAGTILDADADQALSVTFTPTDSVDYTTAVGSTTLTVSPASQTITFAAPATGTAGTSLGLSATGGDSGNAVTFSVDGSSDPGVCAMDGTEADTVDFLTAGSCVVDADQAGSTDYSPAATVQQTIVVSSGGPTAAPFSVTVGGSSSDAVTYGTSAVLAESGLPAGAAGTVTFSTSGIDDLCSFDYPAQTSCSTSESLDAGDYTIAAAFSDTDGTYASSTSTNTVDLTVSQASQTVTFTSTVPPNPSVGDQYVVEAGSSVPGLDVTVSVDPSTGSECHVISSAPNTATVVFDAADTCKIDALQPGDTDYLATGADQTVTFFHADVALPTGAAGWAYLPLTGSDPATGYQASGFDDSSWSTGTAGFGTLDEFCAWNNAPTVETALPDWGADNPTDVFLRHHFTIPVGATNIHIEGTIDNDATVWLNGVEVTTPQTGASYPDTLDVNSGSCESDGINVMADSAANLGGDNVIAVRARNDGGPAFFDLSVSYTPASASQTITFNPPAAATAGTSIVLSATGGPSGNPVTFSVDPNSDPGACAMDATQADTLDFLAAGTCVVDADQAGNGTYAAAPTVKRSVVVTASAGTPFSITADGSAADSITYGSSAALAESGLPADATGTVTFSTSSIANLCSFDYPAATSCSTSTALGAGTYTIGAAFSDTDGTYADSTSTDTVSLEVDQATPVVSWVAPADITYGTALDSTQLDATANVAGTFVYTPGAGTVLDAGSDQLLSVVFTPTDTVDYTQASDTTTINVVQPCAGESYQSTLLANHPEAYWTLGDGSGPSAADASGNNSTGTYSGSVTLGAPSIVQGDCGTAAAFSPGTSGSDSYVTLPGSTFNASTTTGSSQSVELWFETPQTAADWQSNGNAGDGPDGGGVLLSMEQSGPGTYDDAAPILYVGSDGHLYAEESFVDNAVITLRSLATVDDSKPHHAVLTADAASGVETLYLDGQYQQSTSDLGPPPATFDPFTSYGMTNDYIGTGQVINWPADSFPTTNNGWRSFNGTIDEVSVYQSVLSTSEIEADCSAGFATTCSQAAPTNTLTATVSGTETYGGTPTFTPQFSGFVNGDTASAVQGTITGCTTTEPITGVGDYTIAGCSGLSAVNYNIAYDPTGTLVVSPAPQTITFNPPATGTVGTPIPLSASGGASGKPVTFSIDSSSDPGVCAVDADGQTLDLLAAGNCVVDANQTGDANYSDAAPVSAAIVVSPYLKPQTISFTSTPSPNPKPGDTYQVQAQADSGLPITFSIDPNTQSACFVTPLSDTSATVTFSQDDTCTIQADQPGDGVSWRAAPTTTQQVYFDFGQPALSTGAPGWKYVQLAATDSSAGYEAPSFDDAAWSNGTGGFGNNDGGCSWNNPTTVGTPLPDWAASDPGDIFVRHHVDIPAGATWVHIHGTIDNDATVWWNGQEVSPSSGNGGLDIQDGFCQSDGISLVVPGYDVVAGDNLLAIRARNDGGPAFLDVSVTYTPAASSQTIAFAPPTDAVVGGLDTLSATPGASGNPVVFSLDPNLDGGICTLDGDGVTLTYQGAGNCVVHADEAGDATHMAAPTVTATVAVSRAAPLTFAITPSENPATVGDTVVYDAEIVGGGTAPTGTVTFYDGNTDICDSVALSGGSAQCSATYSTADSSVHSITASYSGDVNYTPEGSDNAVPETLVWGQSYVALGDSYSAGEGDGDYSYGSAGVNFCDRSIHAFGPQFDSDASLGSMAFVACSGAVTDDLFNPNNEGNGEPAQMCGAPGVSACPDGTVPWLGPSTQTVTLTIGGNDIGFSQVLSKCVQGSYFGVNVTNATCLSDPTLAQGVQDRIAALAGQGQAMSPTWTDSNGTTHDGVPIHSLADVLAAIHSAAPNAHVFLGVYPGLFGNFSGNCTVGTLYVQNLGNISIDGTVSSDNATQLNALGTQLDQVIAGAALADAPWASPVDTATAFAGHGYCDTGDTWFNPLEANVDSSTGEPTYVQPGSFHPTVTGQQSGMEAAFLAARQTWLAAIGSA